MGLYARRLAVAGLAVLAAAPATAQKYGPDGDIWKYQVPKVPPRGEFDNGGDAVSKAVGGMGLGLRRASSDSVAASAPSAPAASSAPAAAELPNDYLDIPAFLRRQAD